MNLNDSLKKLIYLTIKDILYTSRLALYRLAFIIVKLNGLICTCLKSQNFDDALIELIVINDETLSFVFFYTK